MNTVKNQNIFWLVMGFFYTPCFPSRTSDILSRVKYCSAWFHRSSCDPAMFQYETDPLVPVSLASDTVRSKPQKCHVAGVVVPDGVESVACEQALSRGGGRGGGGWGRRGNFFQRHPRLGSRERLCC